MIKRGAGVAYPSAELTDDFPQIQSCAAAEVVLCAASVALIQPGFRVGWLLGWLTLAKLALHKWSF